jgi:hypothetical protein
LKAIANSQLTSSGTEVGIGITCACRPALNNLFTHYTSRKARCTQNKTNSNSSTKLSKVSKSNDCSDVSGSRSVHGSKSSHEKVG